MKKVLAEITKSGLRSVVFLEYAEDNRAKT